MKINEVEAAVGVTKKNIRFYEEEGLISPRREPGNGYRSYSEADVERLRRIKLLRKLDVPLAEIRQMLEGECPLAEGMPRQLERLNPRRTDLDEAVNFCTLLQKEPVSLNELDVEQTLARLTAKEEQGVSFVNIEQTDRKAERVRGALVGAGLFTALMLFIMGIMVWASCVDPEEAPPLPLLVMTIQEGIDANGVLSEEARDRVEALLKTKFKPEFLNRLDETVLYTPLTRENIRSIMHLMIKRLTDRLQERRLNVVLTPEAEEYILDNGYDATYGARPLKRFIQRALETPIARLLIEQVVPDGSTIVADVNGDELAVHIESLIK